MKCKANVMRPTSFRSEPCAFAASTPAGYCKIHDPEYQAARAAKRPPTLFERQNAARKALDELLATLPADTAEKIKRLVWVIEFG